MISRLKSPSLPAGGVTRCMSAIARRAAAAVFAHPAGSSDRLPILNTARSERMQTAFAAATNCFCVGRLTAAVVVFCELEPPPPQATASMGTSSNGRARRTTPGRYPPEVERVLGGGKGGEDLAELGPATLALLREGELVVDHDVELALVPRHHLGAVLGPVDLGRETRG